MLRAIVATPLGRSTLLLILSLAFLACVLVGFAGAKTALAQEGEESKQPPPKEQQEPPKQEPQKKEQPKSLPPELGPGVVSIGPSITGTCVSTDTGGSITLTGTGWPRWRIVHFHESGDLLSATPPDDNGNFTVRFDDPRYVPGTTWTMVAILKDLDGDIPYSTTVTCPESPGVGETATLSFELTVEGEPPENPEFLGVIRAEEGIWAPLADPDGDSIYTGSTDVPRFPSGAVPPDAEPVSLPVQIVQDLGGTVDSPVNLKVIQDFGEVKLDGDKTFEASVSFNDDSDDSDNNNGGGDSENDGSGGGSSEDDGGSEGGFLSGILPETGGGWAALLLIVGVVLVGGGWLLVRRFSS